MNYTRKELLALPVRAWDQETIYKSIALIPTGKKHSSGYGLIAIIGFAQENSEPVEIAAYCDDVCYSFPEGLPAEGGSACLNSKNPASMPLSRRGSPLKRSSRVP